MAKNLPFRLILGSGSIGRRELMARAGYQFTVLPANIDEPTGDGFDNPRHLVAHIAWLKAAAVAARVDDGVIITADSLSWLDGRPIGKPADREDARRILRLLAGREHELWTGVCVWQRPSDLQLAWQEASRVAMARLSEKEIEHYLDTRTWEGCSGAYAIQEEADPYVQVLSGSTSNVIGLPLERLADVLEWIARDQSTGRARAEPSELLDS